MADIEFGAVHEPEAPEAPGARVARLVNYSGALVSLVLVLGMAVWGYKLLMRDVTGVPVVMALEGPVRITPDDPGGSSAAYQGLAVNEIAAVGSAGGPTDQVTLAPEPAALSDEDKASEELTAERDAAEAEVAAEAEAAAQAQARDLAAEEAPRDPSAPMTEAAIAGATVDDVPDDALATDRAVAAALADGMDDGAIPTLPEPTGDPRADALALAEALSSGVAPLSSDAETQDGPRRDALGLIRSPRPATRPARLAGISRPTNVSQVSAELAVDAEGDAAPGPSGGVEEIDIAALPSGTRLVQLGAFESADVARSQWTKLTGRFADFFDDKRRVVQRAESGGKIFYRLRAEGFQDLADARRFCSTLVAQNADCIPVELR